MEQYVLLQSFLMIFLAEMGDKSQFLMAAMTAHYRTRDILLGSFAAICVLNLLAVFLGSAIGHYLPVWLISLVAGTAFLSFAALSLRGGEEGEERFYVGRRAIPAIIGTYFLSELGDKTQLTAMALAADGDDAFLIFAGATAGLFLSGALGLLVGVLFGKRLPKQLFSAISGVVFFLCGAVRLLDGWEQIFSACAHPTLASVAATLPILFLFVILTVKGRLRHEKDNAGRAKSVPLQRHE